MSDNAVKPARVRFAPSPTGHLHLGGARTALYDYLIARKTGGQFILRIEDTDRNRYVPGAEEELMSGLRWLGIEWDEGPDVGGPYGPYRQSERKEIYQKYARQLVEEDKAFYCFCSAERLKQTREEQMKNHINPHYDGTCREIPLEEADRRIAQGEKYVIRFKSPKTGTTTVKDLLRGDITVDNSTIDDFILVKSDGWALYHLAAMIDDHLMKITHVIRGSEWLPTFPLHCMVYRAFGWEEPIWVHLSVFLKPSGKGKMSKREAADLAKDGYSIFVKDLKDLGYLPEGVVNWIALMGWSLDDHTEFFRLNDLEHQFNLEHLNPSPAAINFTKLDHFNGLHIRNLEPGELSRRMKPFYTAVGQVVNDERLVKIAAMLQERMVTLDEAPEKTGFLFKEKVEPSVEELIPDGLTAQQALDIARQSYAILEASPDLKTETAEPPMRELAEKLGLKPGQVFGILRVAITGQKVSPPLYESMELLGKPVVMQRLMNAIQMLEKK